MSDSLYKLPATDDNPMTTNLDGWVGVEGKPDASMQTWIQHTSKDGSVISGIWKSTTGFYHTTYSAYEFVHLIEGSCTITPDGGSPQSFGPGEAFIVDADFRGEWDITSPIVKHFVIKM